jgi:hypothetical protein
MPQDYAASVQGVAIRVTRLGTDGAPLTGANDSYTTGAFIRTSFTPEYEEGDDIVEKAADGTVCLSYKAPNTIKRVTMEIAVCEPDPELSLLLSGGVLLAGHPDGAAGTAPVTAMGWASPQVGEDPSGSGNLVEVWSRAIQNGKPASVNPYFHWMFPYVKTQLSGDRVVESGMLATTFQGYGLGNDKVGEGVDGRWRWPSITNRPYLYARDAWAPVGLKGWYQWSAGTGAAIPVTSLTDPTAGINIPGQPGYLPPPDYVLNADYGS